MGTQQKNFNVNIDAQLSDGFSAQVEQRGYTKYRAIEGALRGFMALSAEDQVRLISGNLVAEKSSQIKSQAKTLREVLKNMVESSVDGSEMPSMLIEIRPSDKWLWDELRNLIGAEPKKRGKKAKRG